MAHRCLYDSGLPFSKPLDRELMDLNERVQKKNKAGLIIIDGGVGEGKTTLAVLCAEYIQKKKIDFDDQIAMGGMDFLKKLEICFKKKHIVLIYDEAGDFNSRGAITKFNNILNRVFETYRAFKITLILCLPDFSVLDKTLLRKGIVRGLIHCHNRTEKFGDFKIYSLWRMFYLLHKQTKLVVKTDAYKWVVPNIVGHFLNLPESRCKELDVFSTQNKLDILGGITNAQNGLMTYKDLAKLFGCSVEWLENNRKKVGYNPEKTIKNVHYFDDESRRKISKYIDENGISFRKGRLMDNVKKKEN